MLDFDLAKLYQVPTKSLNLAVKRNLKRFPEDFMFQLSKEEFQNLRFQTETSSNKHGGIRYNPYAFTEQGIAMLSSVLNSDLSIDVNISIIRTFVLLRQFALSHKELTAKLKELESKFDRQFKDVAEAINYLLKKEQQISNQQNRKKIGYK